MLGIGILFGPGGFLESSTPSSPDQAFLFRHTVQRRLRQKHFRQTGPHMRRLLRFIQGTTIAFPLQVINQKATPLLKIRFNNKTVFFFIYFDEPPASFSQPALRIFGKGASLITPILQLSSCGWREKKNIKRVWSGHATSVAINRDESPSAMWNVVSYDDYCLAGLLCWSRSHSEQQ